MTVLQYMRHKNIEEIKKTLIILDNTPDKLVELVPGVLAFMNNVGHIRIINIKTLEEVNKEPMEVLGISNNVILLQEPKDWLDNQKKSMVINLDTFDVVLSLQEGLGISDGLIYTTENGIIDKELKEFKVYSTKGNLLYKQFVGYGTTFKRIGKTYIYAIKSTITCQVNNSYEQKSQLTLIKYDVLTDTCKKVFEGQASYSINEISDSTAIVLKNIRTSEPTISALIDFSAIYDGNAEELNKLVYL